MELALEEHAPGATMHNVGQRAEADMTDLHVGLDRIEAALTRLTPGDNDQALRCIR